VPHAGDSAFSFSQAGGRHPGTGGRGAALASSGTTRLPTKLAPDALASARERHEIIGVVGGYGAILLPESAPTTRGQGAGPLHSRAAGLERAREWIVSDSSRRRKAVICQTDCQASELTGNVLETTSDSSSRVISPALRLCFALSPRPPRAQRPPRGWRFSGLNRRLRRPDGVLSGFVSRPFAAPRGRPDLRGRAARIRWGSGRPPCAPDVDR